MSPPSVHFKGDFRIYLYIVSLVVILRNFGSATIGSTSSEGKTPPPKEAPRNFFAIKVFPGSGFMVRARESITVSSAMVMQKDTCDKNGVVCSQLPLL